MYFVLFLFLHMFHLAYAEKSPNTIERESFTLTKIVSAGLLDGVLADRVEIPFQIRSVLYINMASYNAWCNYHPTAIDIFGRSRFKRPRSEHTTSNKNIALLYAIFRIYEAFPQSFGGPAVISSFRKYIQDQGFDPDNFSTNFTSPIAVGNRAGIDTARLMAIDGWNSDGHLTSSNPTYAYPHTDYTGYTPMNNPWTLSHPFRWQPTLRTDGFGLFCRSEHLTPYAGSAIAFTLSPSDIASRKVKSPYRRGNVIAKNVLQRDLKVLKRAAKGVFRTSATLTERERVLAEFFDNKLSAFHTSEKPMGELGIASLLRFVIIGPTLDYSLDEEIVRGLEAIMATFDSLVLAWKEKRRIDAVRPTGQTMEFLFGNQKFEIWGGPGRPNEKIRAGLWKPLIGIMPHSEFPSATACLCTALIEHASILLKGRQFFSYNITVPKGASRFYPGMMPEQDVVIPVNSLSELNYLCGQSRLWAGVHFKDAVDAGRSLCKGLGRSAHGVGERLLAGKKDDTWIKWLGNDVDRFWERE